MSTHQRHFSSLVLCALLAACKGNVPAAPPAPPAPVATAVSATTLVAESVTLTRELPGRVAPSLVAEIRPQVTGIVRERLFNEGSLVTAGQALYQLDNAAYRADANSARASLLRAQAALESTRLKVQRANELVKLGAVSKQDNDNAIAALQQAQADVKVAKAAVDRNDVVLAYGRITSPINGRIGRSAVTQGALVTANQASALATVQQLDPVYVDLTQTSAELLQLRKQLEARTLDGAEEIPVTLVLEDGSRYEQPGKLAFSEVTVDPTTSSFTLRVVVPNPNQMLLPGMYVRAVVGDGVRHNAVLAPQQGIARDVKGNASAMVVDNEGKAQMRSVKVSRAIGDKWLVDDGLVAGDKVIVEGLQKIAPGMPVQVTEAGSAPLGQPVALSK